MMQGDHSEEEEDEEFKKKNSNALPLWGNEKTMNLNSLLLTNIQSSHYFKVNLFEYKTYHEVIDEIYYKVTHLEPWEKGSRKTGGQTGMCGGVRGVGVGGIVSTAFSCLYKLFTLRLTRKQVNGLLNHADSPYLRGLGFMYLRYTQPPADLWSWFEPYLEDDEMIDVKAGGGEEMMVGVLVRKMLTKLDWYGTLFPRIPVPIQMKIQKQLQERFPAIGGPQAGDVRRGPPPRDREREREQEATPNRERQRPPRDIAEEIAMEKERIRREREGSMNRDRPDSKSRDRPDSRGKDCPDSRGRDRPESRGRDRPDSRSRDRPDSRSRDRQGSRTRDHGDIKIRDHRDGRDIRDGRDHRDGRDARDGREHRDGRDGREHRDGRDARDGREHHDGRSRDHRDGKTQDDRRRDHQEVRSREHGEHRSRERHRSSSRSRERRRHRSRSRDRHTSSRKERAKRSRSRERRRRSRSRDREEKRRRRSGSGDRRR